MGNAYVFSLKTDGQSFQTAVNAKLGYPKAGVNAGGGVHCSVAEATTQRESDLLQHPTLTLFAHFESPAVDGVLPSVKASIPTVTVGAPVALDNTWVGANVIVSASASLPV
jgi:hypothetical protein